MYTYRVDARYLQDEGQDLLQRIRTWKEISDLHRNIVRQQRICHFTLAIK